MSEELYSKKIQCPVCKNKFTTMKIKSSKLRVLKRDSDFLTYYKGENPLNYHICICPECGYSALDERFQSISPKNREIIINEVSSKWRKRSYSEMRSFDEAIECYKLALYCGQILNYKKFELGGICLKIAWLYRLKDESKEEMKYLRFSVELYKEAYINENIPYEKMDELTLGYLIGELYRRLGDNKEAISWFGNIVSSSGIKSMPRIEKLAREQWQLAKESVKVS